MEIQPCSSVLIPVSVLKNVTVLLWFVESCICSASIFIITNMMLFIIFLVVLPVTVVALTLNPVEWYQTCKNTADRLSRKVPISFSPSRASSTNGTAANFDITIDSSIRFQNILGFGGALTQSSASVYKSLPDHLQAEIIEAYYSPSNGIGYTTGRMPIHSCDFSEDMYTFDDVVGDINLENFDEDVTYDQSLSLPLIHDALKAKPDLLLFGSPWSPPAWMKDNNEMCCGGHLLDEYKSTWALYISKWISGMNLHDIKR